MVVKDRFRFSVHCLISAIKVAADGARILNNAVMHNVHGGTYNGRNEKNTRYDGNNNWSIRPFYANPKFGNSFGDFVQI